MAKSEPEQVIDLTGGGSRYIEVLTDGGIIRVNAGVTATFSGRPAVLVEVEPNTDYYSRTAPGGHWTVATRSQGSRTDVVLEKYS